MNENYLTKLAISKQKQLSTLLRLGSDWSSNPSF